MKLTLPRVGDIWRYYKTNDLSIIGNYFVQNIFNNIITYKNIDKDSGATHIQNEWYGGEDPESFGKRI